jgi:LEM3-like protein
MTRHKDTISKKKYYVYTLAYPEEMGAAIFYVGKGTGKRMLVHEIYAARSDDNIREYYRNTEKCRVIREIWANGGQVKREIVFETDDEFEAFAYEWALIHMVHRERGLTNINHTGQTKSVYRPPNLPTTGEPVIPVNVGYGSPIIVDGERLYTAKEAIEYLDIPQDAFYRYLKHRLPTYHYGALRRKYYRQSDLDRYRGMLVNALR